MFETAGQAEFTEALLLKLFRIAAEMAAGEGTGGEFFVKSALLRFFNLIAFCGTTLWFSAKSFSMLRETPVMILRRFAV